jgi:flagellar hook-basal body complex protein FliE
LKVGEIDSSRIESMLAQLKAVAQRTEMQTDLNLATQGVSVTNKTGFAEALKASIESVNNSQMIAQKLGQNFAMGDDSVSLSDVMIAGQKAGIAFQTTVQVRNKLVSAYQDIMNMQV